MVANYQILETTEPSNSEVDKNLATPGEILRDAREKSGLSLREVADKLCLVSDQVRAIEESDYKRFHGEIFCKGYIKAYGQLMGVSPDSLIERYLELKPVEPIKPKEKAVSSNAGLNMRKVRQVQVGSVIVLVFLLLFLWLFNVNDDSADGLVVDTEPTASQADMLVNNTTEVLSEGLREEQGELTVESNIVEISNSVDGDLLAVDALRIDELQNDISAQKSAVSVESSIVARYEKGEQGIINRETNLVAGVSLKDQEDVLNFSFSSDCWVQVIDADNKVIFSNLKRADSTLELVGRAPFSILFGYAPAVTLRYNGEPIEVNVNRKNNSARVVIERS